LRAGSGADVFAIRLAEGLRRAGNEPILEWFDHRYELMPWLLRAARAPENVDVVHAGSWQGFAFARPGIPLVVTEHHCSSHPKLQRYMSPLQCMYHAGFVQRCNRASYAKADAIVAVSDFCASETRRQTDKPVNVIHNWIDADLFSPRVQTTELQTPFRLLFVGNPSRRKGFDILEPLARSLGPDFEIQCLAGLRHGDRTRLGAGSMLRLLPTIPEHRMPDVYRSVDAAIVPTRFETFGYVALEAMACGIPVVGFENGGTAEICVNNETALLVPEDDLESLERQIRKLARTPELCAKLGQNGRARAVTVFSEKESVGAYVDTYLSVCKNTNI
jgi:glycosyltransferase involved in cell wall biosynthesis